MKNQLFAHGMMMAAMVGLVGCAGANPVATGDQAQAPQPDRQVFAADSNVQANPELEGLITQLPQRIAVSEAANMLVEIDPNRIEVADEGYSVLQRRSHRGRSYSRSFSRGLRYYGLGGRYWPYYRSAGYYYPYFSSGYYPYLYGASSLYSSYYYNPFFSYYSPYTTAFARYRWPGIYI